tara:strand:- start:512 stop:1456 length:945 start_codon:yes stop_codon:yes gene_type:complete
MSKKRKILVTGISGQDGKILINRLQANEDWELIGLTHNIRRAKDITADACQLEFWDFKKAEVIEKIIKKHKPALLVNLASFATGIGMFDNTAELSMVNGLAVVHLLEAIKKRSADTRFIQAGSSEMFGDTALSPQSEETEMIPRTPYGAAKLFGHNMVKIYRTRYGLHATNLIFYNHESIHRTASFVTQKIVKGAVAIKRGQSKSLELYDLNSARDWSYAPDFIEGIFLVAEQNMPSDYIFASGNLTTVRQLCKIIFGYLELDYKKYVIETNPQSVADNNLLGNPRKIEALGFKRSKDLKEMLIEMVENELKIL